MQGEHEHRVHPELAETGVSALGYEPATAVVEHEDRPHQPTHGVVEHLDRVVDRLRRLAGVAELGYRFPRRQQQEVPHRSVRKRGQASRRFPYLTNRLSARGPYGVGEPSRYF